jgi:hypothetical protein
MIEDQNNLQQRLQSELNSPGSFYKTKEQKDYRASLLQKQTYSSLVNDDLMYQKFITQNYGSYENFLQQNKILQDITVFDPTVDYLLDVTIVTEDAYFKTDHISTQELIMENLSGLCTVWFTKKDGSTRKLSCTLEKQYMPTKEYGVRSQFFSPISGDRVGVWDVNEQAWKSFYMSRVFKFVRDDTSGIE